MLQTRNGKRTARAAVKVAVDMANEGLIDKNTAISRVTPEQVDTLLHPQFDYETKQTASQDGSFFCKGVNASPGAAVGRVYFDADTTQQKTEEEKQDTIMVRPFTKPDDVHGMLAAKGILTSEGGATSHAAVVARQFGVPCVVGASEVKIDLDHKEMSVGDVVVKEGDWISVDGTTGEVFIGKLETHEPSLDEQTDLLTLLAFVRVKALVSQPKVYKFGQMRIIPRMHAGHVPMALVVLVYAVPSICSLNRNAYQVYSE
jgi:pyruvate,orthophosphate dikinase